MAPEVFAGGEVSPRADVFGLAATLWNLLTGEPPGYDDRTPLADSVPDVTPELEEAIRGGLEFIPQRRIASVEAFAQALGGPSLEGRGESLARSVERPAGPEDLMERIALTAAGVFDAAACSIALTDRATGELVYQTAWGAGASEIVGVRLQARARASAASIAASGKAEAVDCRNDPRFEAQIAAGTGYVPYTMLVVPLRRGERDDRRAARCSTAATAGVYGPRDIERAALFADLADRRPRPQAGRLRDRARPSLDAAGCIG